MNFDVRSQTGINMYIINEVQINQWLCFGNANRMGNGKPE